MNETNGRIERDHDLLRENKRLRALLLQAGVDADTALEKANHRADKAERRTKRVSRDANRTIAAGQEELAAPYADTALYRAIIESSTDFAIIATDRSGLVTKWNEGAFQVLGWSEEEMLGRPAEVIFTSEDKDHNVPEAEMQEALQHGRAGDDRWHVCKDGTRFWASGVMMPLHAPGDDEVHLGFLKILRDTTPQRRLEESRQVLVTELQHRVKNILAVVQAIANQTLRSVDEQTAGAFSARLMALARAQDVLTQSDWQEAAIHSVVESALKPFGDELRQFSIEGPPHWLSAQRALSLALALHELGTNAAKYGALSVPSGRIDIRWSREGNFRFVWAEHGGPPVSPPTQKGFGSRLTERATAAEFGGEVQVAYEPGGLVFTLTAPLEKSLKS